jgi:ABC-type antimicrobial peptide transport system permease subunit
MLRIPLVRGRFLDERDTSAAPFAVVISTTLARRYWPHQDPNGQRITFVGADDPMTIVGVVGDVRQPLSSDPRAEALLYLSYQQMPWSSMTLMVAPATTGSAAMAAVREELHRLDPTLAPGPVQSLVELRTAWLVQPRLHATTVAVFGSATLLLTLVGLYARVAHSATSRAREFAVRQAIGARPQDVMRALLGEAALVVLVGIVTGIGLLPVVRPALRHLMADAAVLDLGTTLLTAGLLGAGALGCVYWPSRRAGRVDLAQVMRNE